MGRDAASHLHWFVGRRGGRERERNGRLIQKGRSGGWGDPQAVHSFGAVQVIIQNILQLIFIAI